MWEALPKWNVRLTYHFNPKAPYFENATHLGVLLDTKGLITTTLCKTTFK
jgi:hypothetical protein